MERIEIFHGMEDKEGGFHSLQEAINYWMVESKEMEIIHRETALIQRSSSCVMMVVTIFYREPVKAPEDPLFIGHGVVKKV